MTASQTISQYEPLLYSIAVKMVGSLHDAEDIVQDTLLKWLSQEKEKISNTKAYLVRSVTNNCINHLNSFKSKKLEYIESFKNSSIMEKYREMDLSHLDFEKEISVAVAELHKKLAPLERAVFVLKEVFNVEYDELKDILDKKTDHCRKLFSRAKQKINSDTDLKIINPDLQESGFFHEFKKACTTGDLSSLIKSIKSEIHQEEK